MDLNKAMDDFQTKKAQQLYAQAQRQPWDDFWKLRRQKTKLIVIEMIGVVISLILQLVCGFYQVLPRDILVWWVLPLGIWCLVFFILIYRVQAKMDDLLMELRKEIRSRHDKP